MPPSSPLWQRDLGSDASGVQNTFSSWDACMSKAYCKWPVIVAIIIGSLIVLSILWCCARCLCCGMECCCGCLSCCNACCPSPRNKREKQGYQQPPPLQQYPSYGQYQSPAQHPPVYGAAYAGGYRGGPVPQTATFDEPRKNGGYNEDALPAMPSWDNAQSRHVEDEGDDDMEMEKLDQQPSYAQQQHESLLPDNNGGAGGRYYGSPPRNDASALRGGEGPYHDYGQHQQFVGSPVSTARNSMYPPTYHTSPPSTIYEPTSAYPPSYHTQAPPSVAYGMGRKAVPGSWRDG